MEETHHRWEKDFQFPQPFLKNILISKYFNGRTVITCDYIAILKFQYLFWESPVNYVIWSLAAEIHILQLLT